MNGKVPLLIKIAKLTYGKIISSHKKIVLKNDTAADLKKGPYVYLINHCGIMDPVVVSAVVPGHIRWIAGAYLFKNPFLKFVIGRCCTAISKQQGRSDLSMVKNMKKALEQNDNIGLFPEGTRTWDGDIMPYSAYAVARLLKYCKSSVLFVHLEGAYAQQPRWATYKRKGNICVHITRLISADTVNNLPIDSLQTEIENSFFFSNDSWKKTVDYKYVSGHRAEGIQRLLYLCPCCKKLDTVSAQANKISCSECGAEAVLTDKDDLESKNINFKNLSEWHRWEKENILKQDSFKEEKGVLLQSGNDDNNGKLKTISKDFSVCLKDAKLIVKGENVDLKLALDDITSLILNAKQTMELFADNLLYRIRLTENGCSLKYFDYYNAYKAFNDKE